MYCRLTRKIEDMAGSNRFAALMDTEDEEDGEEQEEQEGGVIYALTVGKEPLVHGHDVVHTVSGCGDIMSATVNSTSTSLPALNTIAFFGRCFQCHYMSHSQKYCPLRQCKTCKQWGHSETVCRGRRVPQNSSGRRDFLQGWEAAASPTGLRGLLLTQLDKEE